MASRLSAAYIALVFLTFGLMVLGALVRAHGAGLACPDWPLCFGEFVPRFDLRVGFEWTHRVVAGSVSVIFATLAFLTLRSPTLRQAVARRVSAAAGLLLLQILLGAFTVWNLLASWTVVSHLVTANAFAVTLLLIALGLRGVSGHLAPGDASLKPWVATTGVLLGFQIVLGGLVSSTYAGLACTEWPACNGGVWFPAWGGSVGLHVLHRLNAYALFAVLCAFVWRARNSPGLASWALFAGLLCSAQILVGIANVVLALPVEITAIHSALAAALVLTMTRIAHSTWTKGEESK